MKNTVTKYKSSGRKNGFTIIEAAIGITIAALIGSVSYNQFTTQRPDMALNNVAWDLMSELRLARSAAIAENTRSVLTFGRDTLTIETDSNRDGIVTNDERRLATFSSDEVTINRSQTDQVAFTGSGRYILNTTSPTLAFETIILRHGTTATEWTLTIYSNGQVKLDKSA